MIASQPHARPARHAGGLPTRKGRPISTTRGAAAGLMDGGGRCGVTIRRSRRARARHRHRYPQCHARQLHAPAALSGGPLWTITRPRPPSADAGRCRGRSGTQGGATGKEEVRHRLPNRARDQLAGTRSTGCRRRCMCCATNLTVYVDEALRQAVHQAVALETSRGWRIARRSRRTESTSSSRSRRRRRASSRSGAYQRGQLPKMRAGGTNHVG